MKIIYLKYICNLQNKTIELNKLKRVCHLKKTKQFQIESAKFHHKLIQFKGRKK